MYLMEGSKVVSGTLEGRVISVDPPISAGTVGQTKAASDMTVTVRWPMGDRKIAVDQLEWKAMKGAWCVNA